jgi:hypothetical protein
MKHAYMVVAVVVVGVLVICPDAHGGLIPINNPGFEDPALGDGEWDWSMDNQGWGYYNNDGNLGPWNLAPADYPGEAPEGLNVGWTEPGEDAEGNALPGGFAQVLSAPLMAGTTYTLTVKVGSSLTYPGGGYAVQLLAGGTPQPTGNGSDYTGSVTGGTLLKEDNNSLTIANGTFVTSTVTYTYNPALHSGLLGEPLQIKLLALDWNEAEFDSVSLEAKLPADKALIAPTKGLYVENGAVYDNYQLDIGHGDWTGDARALVKYDLSSLPHATIARATLYLLQSDLGTADQDGQAQLRRIGTSDWDGTQSAAVLNALVADAKSTAVANFSPASSAPGLYSVDVTSVVRAWADGSQPNYGFGLMQASEGLTNTARQFGANPMLLIEFLLGDANGDGVVDAADYVILKTHMGQATGAGASGGDFNSDGTVDWDDLQLLIAHFGETGGGAPSTVPEPCSAMLLVFGAAALLRRPRA